MARIAVKALAARDEARGIEEVVAGKRPLEGASPVIAFSRRFMQELEGSAPDGDLSGDDES